MSEVATFKTIPAYPDLQLIEWEICGKVFSRVRGIPAGHKPNRNRPFYRKVKVTIPMYFVAGNKAYCHPSIVARMREKIAKTVTAQIEAAIFRGYA
jgi:hypothetical protein